MKSTRIWPGPVVLTLAAGCGKKIAEGPDFTLPIPSGFTSSPQRARRSPWLAPDHARTW